MLHFARGVYFKLFLMTLNKEFIFVSSVNEFIVATVKCCVSFAAQTELSYVFTRACASERLKVISCALERLVETCNNNKQPVTRLKWRELRHSASVSIPSMEWAPSGFFAEKESEGGDAYCHVTSVELLSPPIILKRKHSLENSEVWHLRPQWFECFRLSDIHIISTVWNITKGTRKERKMKGNINISKKQSAYLSFHETRDSNLCIIGTRVLQVVTTRRHNPEHYSARP